MTTDPLTLTAALIIGTLAVARAVRLVTSDAYPPVEQIRGRWVVWQANRDAHQPSGWGWHSVRYGWSALLTCPFCFAPYATAVNLAWALLAGLSWDGFWSQAWWVVNVWAAVSYAAAMVVVRDEPADD